MIVYRKLLRGQTFVGLTILLSHPLIATRISV